MTCKQVYLRHAAGTIIAAECPLDRGLAHEMKESKHRPAPRYITALWVVMAHLAAITALLMAPVNPGHMDSAAKSIQLLYVAPVHPPKVPNVTANLPRAGNNLNVKVDPPVLTALSF